MPEAPIGLEVVYQPIRPLEAIIDIVVVHGIGARPDRSWSYRAPDGTRLNWLNDDTMLPAEFPDVRVLAFGYKSAWFGNDISHTSLSGLAKMLRDTLEIERRNCPERPLIFIAHCFGGLIVVAALAETPQDLFDSTIGTIFLGTPFRGANDKFPKMVKFLEKGMSISILKDILEYLKKDNIEVREAVRRLKNLKDNSPKNLPRIYCVNETQESDIASVWRSTVNVASFLVPKIKIMVVEKQSADLGVGEMSSFQRDHFQLNKFEGPNDTHFGQLCRMLRKIREMHFHDVPPTPLIPEFPRVSQESIAHDMVEFRPSYEELQQEDDRELEQRNEVMLHFQPSQWRESRLPDFDHSGMVARKMTLEIQHPSGLNPLGRESREWRKRRFDAAAAGLSLDCKFVFLRNKSVIRIFSVDDFKDYDRTKEYPKGWQHPFVPAPGKTEDIRFACLGITICAFITSSKCLLWDFANANNREPKSIRALEESNLFEYKCIAISETEGPDRSILLAIGMENTQGLDDEGMVRLLEVSSSSLADSNHIDFKEINTFVLKDQKTDYPKTLSFSRDGSILVCTTGHRNQVHAWRISREGPNRKAVAICRTTRPCKTGVGAKGITSAISWLTARQHPYVLCTTVPSTERKDSDGGEWTFMSPLSTPLPSADDSPLYHCFLQIQGLKFRQHLKIHAAAVSPWGNLIALLDSNGKICLIPIQRQEVGGLVSDNKVPPIEVGDLSIGDNEQLRGDLRFNKNGTKLFAVTGKAGIVVSFPNATPFQQAPPALRTLQSSSEKPPQLAPLPFENSRPSSSIANSSRETSSQATLATLNHSDM